MNAETNQIYQSALQLPDNDRAELAAWLIESLDATVDEETESAWDQEIKKRLDELDRGDVAAIPWTDARRMIMGQADSPLV